MDKNKIEDILRDIRNTTTKIRVWKEADKKTIQLYETAFGALLPEDFKAFLEYSNGLDEIVLTEEAKYLWQQGEYEEARQLGSKILSVEEVFEEYEDMSINDWKIPAGYKGFYPYVPFCVAGDGEKLVFINQMLCKDSTIFYAYHDEPPSAWRAVSKNFTEFLDFFVHSKGKIPAEDAVKNVNAEDFLKKYDTRLMQEKFEDPGEEIKRSSAYLELFPKDSLSFITRGNALVEINKYKEALSDFNKAIKLNPKSGFAYQSRGRMFMKIKKARQALTDFDSACKLRPDDLYYLTSRAEAFYELNKMDKALDDCNKVIEIDSRFFLAYMTRYNIYLYLAEADKAEADAKMIEKLLAE